jgi:hypothetical protein
MDREPVEITGRGADAVIDPSQRTVSSISVRNRTASGLAIKKDSRSGVCEPADLGNR